VIICCSQRSCAVGDLDQRRLGNERGPITPAQRRRDQTGADAVRGRSRGGGRSSSLHFARFLLGMGSDARVSVLQYNNVIIIYSL